ncbi:MAG: hypothetical protein IPI46_01910 [Bacteroidetes bacterium]|nr:hypothetical protein [Bacteroidota bacterium]
MNRITLYIICIASTLSLFSCKKESVKSINGTVWIKILEDSEVSSTDEELYQGRNGKVITDKAGNIFVYFFNRTKSQTTLLKYNSEGAILWRKTFENSVGMDMITLPDESVILAVDDPKQSIPGMTLYAFRQSGNIDSMKIYSYTTYSNRFEHGICMSALDDNSIIISSSSPCSKSSSFNLINCSHFIKIEPAFKIDWRTIYWFFDNPNMAGLNEFWNQNSIIPTANNKFLFQYAMETIPDLTDSNYYQLVTGLMNSNGTYDTSYRTSTGYHYKSQNKKSGVRNRYTNGLLYDGAGGYVFHYSNPEVFGNTPAISSGFIRIGADAKIKDTIPIPLPAGYRITSFTLGNGRFLLSAYKSGVMNGGSDFVAEKTIFLSGGSDLVTTNTFSFQNYYSDFFSSITPTNDGAFLIMGKIQSFNRPNNKLALIKYKVP